MDIGLLGATPSSAAVKTTSRSASLANDAGGTATPAPFADSMAQAREAASTARTASRSTGSVGAGPEGRGPAGQFVGDDAQAEDLASASPRTRDTDEPDTDDPLHPALPDASVQDPAQLPTLTLLGPLPLTPATAQSISAQDRIAGGDASAMLGGKPVTGSSPPLQATIGLDLESDSAAGPWVSGSLGPGNARLPSADSNIADALRRSNVSPDARGDARRETAPSLQQSIVVASRRAATSPARFLDDALVNTPAAPALADHGLSRETLSSSLPRLEVGRSIEALTEGSGGWLSSSAASAAGLASHGGTTAGATPSAIPSASLPVSVHSPQWPAALGQQLVQWQQRGDHQMQLHLHPQELGALDVTLNVREQQAQLHIASGHAAARAAVEAALPQLRDALAQNGITLGQASVGDHGAFDQGGFQQDSSGRQDFQRTASRDGPRHDGSIDALTPAIDERATGDALLDPLARGRVNLYA